MPRGWRPPAARKRKTLLVICRAPPLTDRMTHPSPGLGLEMIERKRRLLLLYRNGYFQWKLISQKPQAIFSTELRLLERPGRSPERAHFS